MCRHPVGPKDASGAEAWTARQAALAVSSSVPPTGARAGGGLWRSIRASAESTAACCFGPPVGSTRTPCAGTPRPTSMPIRSASHASDAASVMASSHSRSCGLFRFSSTSSTPACGAACSRTTSSPVRAVRFHATLRGESPGLYSRTPKNSTPAPRRVCAWCPVCACVTSARSASRRIATVRGKTRIDCACAHEIDLGNSPNGNALRTRTPTSGASPRARGVTSAEATPSSPGPTWSSRASQSPSRRRRRSSDSCPAPESSSLIHSAKAGSRRAVFDTR